MAGADGNIITYIKKNTNQLSTENYNEVDGLVFSQLSYMRYEDVEWPEGEVSVSEFAKKLSENSSEKDNNTRFLKALAQNPRYKNCIITDMATLNGRKYWQNGEEKFQFGDGQWAALTIKIGSDTSDVAMRGTNGTQLGWDEDFELAYTKNGTTAQKMSRDYLENTTVENIYLAGHSKAANDVTSAYVMSDISTRDRVKRIDAYDGPANNDDFKKKYAAGYLDIEKKLYNHYPKDSIIGMLLGGSPGLRDFCKADVEGHQMEGSVIGQHDPYAWRISEDLDSFDGTDQSDFSRNLNYTLDGIVENYDGIGRYRLGTLLTQLGVSSLLDESYGTGRKAFSVLSGIGSLTIVDMFFISNLMGNSMIELKKEPLQAGVEAMRRCGDNILSIRTNIPSLTGNSEVLESYKECFEKLQSVMESYASLLKSDGNRFLSAGEALIQEDESVLK